MYEFSTTKGVRQGVSMSPKLLNSANWNNKDLSIAGEYMNHLGFTDDIILIAQIPEELQEIKNGQ